MTKSTQRKWKRANRMTDWIDNKQQRTSAGRYPDSLWWSLKHVPGWHRDVTASLALDGLSIKELP